MRKSVLFICIMVSSFFMSGCSSNDDEKYQTTPFLDKIAFRELGGGWVEYLYINVYKTNPTSHQVKGNYDLANINEVFYDVVNLRDYANGESYIPVYNENDEEIDKINSEISSHILTKGKREEIFKLNEFLTEKKFDKPITLDDLSDFSANTVDMKSIVSLYNDALKRETEIKNNNSYISNKGTAIFEEELSDGSKLRVGYIIELDSIAYINLEYINKKSEIISVLCESGKASAEQIEIQRTLDKIEKEIIETQSIEVKENSDLIPDFNKSINKLLNKSFIVKKVK